MDHMEGSDISAGVHFVSKNSFVFCYRGRNDSDCEKMECCGYHGRFHIPRVSCQLAYSGRELSIRSKLTG